jgi:hypothetical protein
VKSAFLSVRAPGDRGIGCEARAGQSIGIFAAAGSAAKENMKMLIEEGGSE